MVFASAVWKHSSTGKIMMAGCGHHCTLAEGYDTGIAQMQ